MTTERVLKSNLERIQENIVSACSRSGRPPGSVTLVAVTKTIPLPIVEHLLDLGVEHLGESRIQEALPKIAALSLSKGRRTATWHLVGHLQANKAKKAVDHVGWVHSIDSLSLAADLERRLAAAGKRMRGLVEVNVSGEPTKFGLQPVEVEGFFRAAASFLHLDLCGLMTMAPLSQDPETSRPIFHELAALRERLGRQVPWKEKLTELSMGMSQDYCVAIEEGATLIRVGSALFEGISGNDDPTTSSGGGGGNDD